MTITRLPLDPATELTLVDEAREGRSVEPAAFDHHAPGALDEAVAPMKDGKVDKR